MASVSGFWPISEGEKLLLSQSESLSGVPVSWDFWLVSEDEKRLALPIREAPA
jgi:hypothetical protein